MIKIDHYKSTICALLFLVSFTMNNNAQILDNDSINQTLNFVYKVIENKAKNRIENNDYHQFNQYEKLVISVNEMDSLLQNEQAFEKIKFIFEYIDTTDVANGKSLTLSIREVFSEEYRRKKRDSQKSIITAVRHEGLDKKIKSDLVDAMFIEAIKHVDVTDNEINLLFRRFVSPLSPSGADSFYNYSIVDTVKYSGDECINLSFSPKNNQDMGFSGNLWIVNDSTYSIKKVVLKTLPDINLNFVSGLTITQEFTLRKDGQWIKTKEFSDLALSIFKIKYALHIRDERIYTHYKIDSVAPIEFGFNDEILMNRQAENKSDSFWNTSRPTPLKKGELRVKEFSSDASSKIPHYQTWAHLADILVNNYAYTGKSKRESKFDIGPIWSTISRNDVEGYRFRLGGRTTANFDDHWFFGGYGAYGTKDKEIKYSGEVIYSFYPRIFHENEYRKNNVGFVFQNDIQTPGQQYYFTDPDNIFLSFKRGKADKMTYIRKAETWYEREFTSGFSMKLWTKSWNEAAAGALQFQKEVDGQTIDVGDYDATELGFIMRFAFNEKFYQGRDSRMIIRRDGPVFSLKQSFGVHGVFGDYSYAFTELSVQKRFWLSGYGKLNLIFKAGKLWGEVPYPMLILPNANQTYTIQPESYSMMNTLEFMNDQYTSLDLAYHLDGWLFNRVDFIRKFKLREVMSFKALMGSLRNENNPSYNHDLFLFPEDSYIMDRQPYMELSLGIENIFRVLRVDYVRRLTYLDHADIDKNGVRVTINLSF